MLMCESVVCSGLKCVAVCCSVLQISYPDFPVRHCHDESLHALSPHAALLLLVDTFKLQCVAVCCSVLQCVAVCCSVLQCVAVYCSVLQCVAVCCRVLQCVAV